MRHESGGGRRGRRRHDRQETRHDSQETRQTPAQKLQTRTNVSEVRRSPSVYCSANVCFARSVQNLAKRTGRSIGEDVLLDPLPCQDLLRADIRVGRRHAFYHVPARLTSRVCVFADLLAGPALPNETPAARAHSWPRGLAFKRQILWGTCPRSYADPARARTALYSG